MANFRMNQTVRILTPAPCAEESTRHLVGSLGTIVGIDEGWEKDAVWCVYDVATVDGYIWSYDEEMLEAVKSAFSA